jgi:hypothetical protein
LSLSSIMRCLCGTQRQTLPTKHCKNAGFIEPARVEAVMDGA